MAKITLNPGPVRDTLEAHGLVKPPALPSIEDMTEFASMKGIVVKSRADTTGFQGTLILPDDWGDVGVEIEFGSSSIDQFQFLFADALTRALQRSPQQAELF